MASFFGKYKTTNCREKKCGLNPVIDNLIYFISTRFSNLVGRFFCFKIASREMFLRSKYANDSKELKPQETVKLLNFPGEAFLKKLLWKRDPKLLIKAKISEADKSGIKLFNNEMRVYLGNI